VGGDPLSPRAADGSELVRPQLLVPAYFHPATHPDDWAWLAEHAAQIRMIVLNLASGPGAQPDSAFFPALDRLRSAGVTVMRLRRVTIPPASPWRRPSM